MGMDIYLYKVLEPNTEDYDEIEIIDESFPKAIRDKSFFQDNEYYDIKGCVEYYGKDFNKLEGQGGRIKDDKIYWTFEFEDGTELEVPEEEMKNKFTVTYKEKVVKVKEIGYARYGYCGDNFIEGYHPFFEDKAKDIIKDYYWKPEELEKIRFIFKDKTRIDRIIGHFKEVINNGELCFVYISW